MHRFKIGFLSFTAMLLTASWLYGASFEQAMEQYKSKKWAQAADAFESVYKDAKQKDDTGNKAFRYMVNALLMDQTPNSLTRLTEVAREWPDNIFVQQKYAFAMMFINEWSQAIELLKEIRNKGDNSSVTLAGIAVSHYNAGNYLQAHAFFKELVLLKKRAGWEYMVQLSCRFTGTCTPSPPPSGDLTIETLLAQVGAGLSFESAMEKTRDFDFDPEDTRYLEFAAGEYARFKGDQKTARQHLESAHKGFADAPGFMTMLTRSGLDKLDQSRTAETASKKLQTLQVLKVGQPLGIPIHVPGRGSLYRHRPCNRPDRG